MSVPVSNEECKKELRKGKDKLRDKNRKKMNGENVTDSTNVKNKGKDNRDSASVSVNANEKDK